ncbi:class I SAM-dependent methyltransferase [Thermococcus sp.]
MPLDRFFQPLRRALSFAKAKVLEIGIATGKTLRFYPKDVDLYAIDGTEKSSKLQREKRKTGYSSFVFCIIPNPAGAMFEIRRILS